MPYSGREAIDEWGSQFKIGGIAQNIICRLNPNASSECVEL